MPADPEVAEEESQPKQPKLFTKAGLITVVAVVVIQLTVVAVVWLMYRKPPDAEVPDLQALAEVAVVEDWVGLYAGPGPQRTGLNIDYEITVSTSVDHQQQVADAVAANRAQIKQEVQAEIRRLSHDDALNGNVAGLKKRVKTLVEEFVGVEGSIRDVFVSWKATR